MFKDNNTPIYAQIASLIEDEILLGHLKENERVYSTNELSALYEVNPATAGKGLNLLIDEGILYKKRGVGMFVDKDAKKNIQKKRSQAFMESFFSAFVAEAIRLGIDKETLIEMIKAHSWKEEV